MKFCTPGVKVTNIKLFERIGLVSMSIRVKYQRSSSHGWKVVSKVKVSDRIKEWQIGQK